MARIFFCFLLVAEAALADSDPVNYKIEINRSQPGKIQALDSDFFQKTKPKPTKRPVAPEKARDYGCEAAWASGPGEKAQVVGPILRKLSKNKACASTPTVNWIPSDPVWQSMASSEGYFQVCCSRKSQALSYGR